MLVPEWTLMASLLGRIPAVSIASPWTLAPEWTSMSLGLVSVVSVASSFLSAIKWTSMSLELVSAVLIASSCASASEWTSVSLKLVPAVLVALPFPLVSKWTSITPLLGQIPAVLIASPWASAPEWTLMSLVLVPAVSAIDRIDNRCGGAVPFYTFFAWWRPNFYCTHIHKLMTHRSATCSASLHILRHYYINLLSM